MNKRLLYVSSIVPSQNGAGSNIEYQLLKDIQKRKSSFQIDAVIIKSDKDYGLETDSASLFKKVKIYSLNNFDRIINSIFFFYLPGMMVFRLNIRVLLFLLLNKQKYDYVFYGFSQSAIYSILLKRLYPNALHILTIHDVLFQAFERKKDNYSFGLLKVYYHLEYIKAKIFEPLLYDNMSYLLFLSQKDKSLFAFSDEQAFLLVPYYKQFEFLNSEFTKDEFHICYWGSFKRFENIDAVKYYLQNVHPIFVSKFLKYVFSPIGYDANKHFVSDTNIHVVSDPIEPAIFLIRSTLAFIWLRFGAGVKIKVLELLQLGIPVVTNNIGGEGIPPTLGLFICNDIEEAVSIVVKIWNGQIQINKTAIHEEFLRNFSLSKNSDLINRIFKP
jgi:hypothetical protein